MTALDRLAMFLATAGYAGYAPVAPGTAGSVVGLAIYVVLRALDNALAEASVIILMLAIGIWSAGVVERQLGKDPSPVVIDEVAGMLITVGFLDLTPIGALAGFVLFRILDVIKPFPARRLEDLHGGPGIMLDDVMVGLYGQLLMRVLIASAPGVFA